MLKECKRAIYLMTRTDQPRFWGSELSVLSNVERISCVKVLESERVRFLVRNAEESFSQALTRKP